MGPGLAIAAEGEFRRAEDIVGAGGDRDNDAGDGDRLRRPVQKSTNHQQVFVRAETSGVHPDGVDQHGDLYQGGHAEPSRRGIRNAGKGKSQPGQADGWDQYEKGFTKCDVLGQPFAKNHDIASFGAICGSHCGLVYKSNRESLNRHSTDKLKNTYGRVAGIFWISGIFCRRLYRWQRRK